MNSLYNHALKQTHALQRDLDSKLAFIYKINLFNILLFTMQNFNQDKMPRQVYKVNKINKLLLFITILSLGQISASFNSLQRSIDDYENLAKREMIAVKKETALT